MDQTLNWALSVLAQGVAGLTGAAREFVDHRDHGPPQGMGRIRAGEQAGVIGRDPQRQPVAAIAQRLYLRFCKVQDVLEL